MNHPSRWRETGRRKLQDCRIFNVSAVDRESTDGRSGTFFVIDSPDWAGVIPVVDTPEGRKFVMIQQYRHGTDHVSIEFPGGIVDRGENPAYAVARELEEETGYRAEMVLPLGILSPNPAMMTNRFHAFIAEGCHLVRLQELDEHEEIKVLLVPEQDAINMIGGEDMGHALMTATLFFYARYMGRLD